MEDLSLHILDIAENSIAAQADKIEIRIRQDGDQDIISIEIIDNGLGMDKQTLEKALDPFYTSKKVRRFGFGLSLLSEAAKAANGHFSIQSKKGEGTRVKADFQLSHIDRQPLGDIGQTLISLIIGNPEIEFLFEHKKNGHTFVLDTRIIKAQLNKMPINSVAGIKKIRESLKKRQEPPTV